MTCTNEKDGRNTSLEDGLRRDAVEWGGQPSVACQAHLRTIATQTPRPGSRRRLPVWAAAAAIAVVSCLIWSPWTGDATPTPTPGPRLVEVDWIAPVVAPLERELDAVTSDAVALADAMWERVPTRVRRLFD